MQDKCQDPGVGTHTCVHSYTQSHSTKQLCTGTRVLYVTSLPHECGLIYIMYMYRYNVRTFLFLHLPSVLFDSLYHRYTVGQGYRQLCYRYRCRDLLRFAGLPEALLPMPAAPVFPLTFFKFYFSNREPTKTWKHKPKHVVDVHEEGSRGSDVESPRQD